MAVTISAYTVYWYDAQKVGYGMAGRIVDLVNSVTTAPGMRASPDLNGDPKVEGFVDAGSNLRIAVTDREANMNRPVYIHDALDGSTVATPTPTWPEQNLYTLVRLGAYLYAIDYDNAKVIEINASTYLATGVSYTLESKFVPSGRQAVGQALIVIGSKLYGLFSFPDSTWNSYAPSLLVRFTLNPGVSITVADTPNETGYNKNIAPNAFSMAVQGTDLYIAAIGGKQTTSGYNSDSRLQKIAYGTLKLNNATVTDVITPDAATFPYDIRDISFKGSTAYVLAGTYGPGPTPTDPWVMKGKLFSTTDFKISTLSVIDDFTAGVTGYYWAAQYTPDNDRIWYARGNDIWVYNASALTPPSSTPIAMLPMSTLKGGGNYDSLNDLTYVGAAGNISLRGYRSPLQRSNTPFAQTARALTRGRPELTEAEFQQLRGSED
jgi:hypothetical protein